MYYASIYHQGPRRVPGPLFQVIIIIFLNALFNTRPTKGLHSGSLFKYIIIFKNVLLFNTRPTKAGSRGPNNCNSSWPFDEAMVMDLEPTMLEVCIEYRRVFDFYYGQILTITPLYNWNQPCWRCVETCILCIDMYFMYNHVFYLHAGGV